MSNWWTDAAVFSANFTLKHLIPLLYRFNPNFSFRYKPNAKGLILVSVYGAPREYKPRLLNYTRENSNSGITRELQL